MSLGEIYEAPNETIFANLQIFVLNLQTLFQTELFYAKLEIFIPNVIFFLF